METRLQLLRKKLATNNVEAFLISKPENYRYLSGFTGSSGILIITSDQAILLTDFRYVEQARREAAGYEVVMYKDRLLDKLADILAETSTKRVGIESDFFTVKQYYDYRARLKNFRVKPLENIVEGLRIVKSEAEIDKIRKAADLSSEGYRYILPHIKPGVTEKNIALELEFFLRQRGAEKIGFDIVVASGERAAMPHASASQKKLNRGELVIIDFGVVYQGYHSDVSRTVVLGEATPRQKRVYQTVQKAQEIALRAVRTKITAAAVDKVSRHHITEQGYGENFGHGLGHGVGLEIHEAPSLNPTSGERLKAGMVFTIEPGVYLSRFGGVRIEDVVVLRKDGIEILTKSPKDLLEI